MDLRLIDIGGSGVKTLLTNSNEITNINDENVSHFTKPDWSNFAAWLSKNNLLDSKYIGISCAGFIQGTGTVKMFRVGNWHNEPIVNNINQYVPDSIVRLLNDGEAHLMAHTDLVKNPVMNISLGTSLGFAICDIEGKIIRAQNGINFDLGAFPLRTRATNNQIWWALGSQGLAELEKNLGQEKGVIQFGYRLGAFLSSISSIFRPKTIVLSGGITEKWWDYFQASLFGEFNHNKPDWLEETNIIKSPYPKYAALTGMGKYLLKR